MFLTPFIFNHLHLITKWFLEDVADNEELVEKSKITEHVIVCGYGGLGQKIVKRLKQMYLPYIVIERDRKLIKYGINQKDVVIFGNAAKYSLLKKVNITQAQAVIIAITNDKEIQLVSSAIRHFFPEVKIIAGAANLRQKQDLEKMHVDYIVNEMEVTANSFLDILIEDKA